MEFVLLKFSMAAHLRSSDCNNGEVSVGNDPLKTFSDKSCGYIIRVNGFRSTEPEYIAHDVGESEKQ